MYTPSVNLSSRYIDVLYLWWFKVGVVFPSSGISVYFFSFVFLFKIKKIILILKKMTERMLYFFMSSPLPTWTWTYKWVTAVMFGALIIPKIIFTLCAYCFNLFIKVSCCSPLIWNTSIRHEGNLPITSQHNGKAPKRNSFHFLYDLLWFARQCLDNTQVEMKHKNQYGHRLGKKMTDRTLLWNRKPFLGFHKWKITFLPTPKRSMSRLFKS